MSQRCSFLIATSVTTLLAIAAVVMEGASCAPNPTPQPGSTEVAIQGLAFVPKAVTINQGGTVRWTNHDLVLHTVTSGNPIDANPGILFDSGDLAAGQSYMHQFNVAGTFTYFCRHHPTTPAMVDATVTVIP